MRFEIYCDESRPDLLASARSPARYLLIGGLWVPSEERDRLKAEIHALRNRFKIGGEFKWNKVSPSRIPFYEELVRWFFRQGDTLRFRCIVIDKGQVDLERFHENDQELGFYKFYYQLLHHWISEGDEFAIFVDFKSNRNRDRLRVLQECLQRANPLALIERVQAVRSEEQVLIQAVDVLTGAVGRKLNGPVSSQSAKARVVEKIEAQLGHEIGGTPRTERKFNVFKIALRGGK